jgi:hypothetical protein
VAENGAGAAAENGGHPPTAVRQHSVADRIDTAVNAVKSAGADSNLDLAGCEADPMELGHSDDAVLAFCEASHPDVTSRSRLATFRRSWVKSPFPTYAVGFVPFTGHGPSVAEWMSPLNAWMCRARRDFEAKA